MVNYALVDQKIQKGYAKVGKYIGAVYTVYRAQGPNDPISPANVVTQTNAAIDVSAKMTSPAVTVPPTVPFTVALTRGFDWT